MIKIKKSDDGLYYFTVLAGNGQVLVTSETYDSKQSCNKAINSLIKNLRNGEVKISDTTYS